MNTTTLPPWTPLRPAEPEEMTALERLERAEAIAREFGCTVAEAMRELHDIERNQQLWINSRYQVNVRRQKHGDPSAPGLVHLSIKRRDKQQIGIERYRDFMLIKDELLGPEYEAVEIYPARSREIDTSNQYHLWVIDDPTFRVPFGFGGRKVLGPVPNGASGAVQSPFEPHHPQ